MSKTSWYAKMLGTSMTLNNLESVLILQLQDLSNAEDQIIAGLPAMIAAANSKELRDALQNHLLETRQQKERLMEALRLMGATPASETCEAMQGLITEAEEIIRLEGDPDVKDAALIAAAQRIEHYEIAGYGCARTFARRLGQPKVVQLLQQSLDEESHADKILTEIAENVVNIQAVNA